MPSRPTADSVRQVFWPLATGHYCTGLPAVPAQCNGTAGSHLPLSQRPIPMQLLQALSALHPFNALKY